MPIETGAKALDSTSDATVTSSLDAGIGSQLQSGSYNEVQSILSASDKSKANSVNMAPFGNLEISDSKPKQSDADQDTTYHTQTEILPAEKISNDGQITSTTASVTESVSDSSDAPPPPTNQNTMESVWQTNADGTSSFHNEEVTIHQNGDPDYPDVPAPPPTVEIQDLTPPGFPNPTGQ